MAFAVTDNVTSPYQSHTTMSSAEVDYYDINYRVNTYLPQPHSVIAIIFGIISILLNILILVILHKVQRKLTSHYQLIVSLAIADMLVSGSVLLFNLNKTFNPLYPRGTPTLGRCWHLIVKALNTTGLNITLLNLMTMAIDHYIAIIKPLQYPVILTRVRVVVIIVVVWVVAFTLGFSDFITGLFPKESVPKTYTYCDCVVSSRYTEEFTVFAIAPICLGIMLFIYSRIYLRVLNREQPGTEELATSRRQNRRNNKALITTLLIIGTFVLAWLPLIVLEITLLLMSPTHRDYLRRPDVQATIFHTNQHLFNLLIFNAIADPVIYTIRMKEVQQGFLRLLCCCCPGAAVPRGARRGAAGLRGDPSVALTHVTSMHSFRRPFLEIRGSHSGGYTDA